MRWRALAGSQQIAARITYVQMDAISAALAKAEGRS
jgi:hypothetical protein